VRFENGATRTPEVKYIYGGGKRIAMEKDGGIYYYHPDRLGSVRLITDASGTVLKRYNYTAFGSVLSDSGSFDNEYKFTSQAIDEENDLYYMHARYYDKSIGRFLSTDPFPGYRSIPSTMHPYNYCAGNPVNFVDPLGMGHWDVDDDGNPMYVFDEDEGASVTEKKEDYYLEPVYITCLPSPDLGEEEDVWLESFDPLGYDPTDENNAEFQNDPTGHRGNGNWDPPLRDDLVTWVDTRSYNEKEAAWAKFMKTIHPADVTKTYQSKSPYGDFNVSIGLPIPISPQVTLGIAFGEDSEGQIVHFYLGGGVGAGILPVSVMVTGSLYPTPNKGWYRAVSVGAGPAWQGGINEQQGTWYNEWGGLLNVGGGIYRFYMFR